MKLKELQSILQVESTFEDLGGATVVDLGCGTGMLAIGAALLGCGHVVGVDIDDSALAVAVRNLQQFEEPLPVDLVIGDVFNLDRQQPLLQADTVIMNPPFGTRRKGADMDFLRAALRLSRHAVYSLHKTSTRNHIKTVALRDMGAREAEVLAEMRYDLPASYSFHKMKSKDIAVDLWRFVVAPKGAA